MNHYKKPDLFAVSVDRLKLSTDPKWSDPLNNLYWNNTLPKSLITCSFIPGRPVKVPMIKELHQGLVKQFNSEL